MRKLIGTCTIIVVLYLGFFGSKRFNVDPFITNWLVDDKNQEYIDKGVDSVKNGVDTITSDAKVNLKKLLLKEQ